MSDYIIYDEELDLTSSTSQEENRELKKVNKSVSNQRDLAIRQFDQLIIEKQCLETELYGKVSSSRTLILIFILYTQFNTQFVELLNEKKKKIRELKDERKFERGSRSPI